MFDEFLREPGGDDRRGVRALRREGRLRRVRRRQAALRRGALVPRSRGASSCPRAVLATPPDAETIDGLGNRKNELVLQNDQRPDGVEVVRGIGALRARGPRRRTAPRRGLLERQRREVLVAAGIDDLFEEVVDGVVAEREHLKGKPAPDTFLAGAGGSGCEPAEAAVFEDALAGVEAGRAGGFGYVVGVDRVGQADALREHGADVVVDDLAELLPARDRAARRSPSSRGRSARPSSTSTSSPRPSRCSRWPTGTSGCAATSTRASRSACRAPTWAASTSSGRCPYAEAGLRLPEDGPDRRQRDQRQDHPAAGRGRAASTSATARCARTSACSTCAPGCCAAPSSGCRRPARGAGRARRGWCRSPSARSRPSSTRSSRSRSASAGRGAVGAGGQRAGAATSATTRGRRRQLRDAAGRRVHTPREGRRAIAGAPHQGQRAARGRGDGP